MIEPKGPRDRRPESSRNFERTADQERALEQIRAYELTRIVFDGDPDDPEVRMARELLERRRDSASDRAELSAIQAWLRGQIEQAEDAEAHSYKEGALDAYRITLRRVNSLLKEASRAEPV